MKLLKYTNTTNPTAPITGCCILTDADIQTLLAKRAEIKALITDKKKFITRVGEGFIMFNDGTELDGLVSISNITAAEATRLQELGIAETGFARHFVDGVLNWLETSFVDVPVETETIV
jgi:hypothetical protein